MLELLCGRIARQFPYALGARYGRDGSDLPLAAVVAEMLESRRYHAREAHGVGAHGLCLMVRVEGGVLEADSRDVEIDVHPAELAYQLLELRRGLAARDVDVLPFNPPREAGGKLFHHPVLASGHADGPSRRGIHLGHPQPYARGGAHNHYSFHIVYVA